MKYVHTNIVSKNWKKLAEFYVTVFDCNPVPPERNQFGHWLEIGTGVPNASLKGIHLLLPGYGESGPTLEIYQYSEILESERPQPNRLGLAHLAFEVDDVEITLQNLLDTGGNKVGEISETIIEGLGCIKFVYASDPEGNLIEIQSWES